MLSNSSVATILLIGCICLLEQVAKAVPLEEEQKLETCLKDANSKLAALEVPDKVKELAEMATNNGLDGIYLLDLVGSSKDNIKKAEQVFKSVATRHGYEKGCLLFDESAMSLIRSFACESKVLEFSSVSALSNLNYLGPDNAVNKINRYRTACIMMKLSV